MSHKSGWSGLVLAAVASLVIGIALFWLRLPPVAAPPDPVPSAPFPVPEQVLTRMETTAAVTARQRLVRIPEPVVPDDPGGYPPEAVSTVIASYREMLAVQGLYNQHSSRERLVARILETPRGAEIAANTLADPVFARNVFGALQAEARFFSVMVLKAAALQGNEELLFRSADAIARELSLVKDEAAPLDEGRSTDLRDLVETSLDVRGTDALAGMDSRFLRELGYSQVMPERVKAIYDEVLFLRLKRQFGRERAAAMTQALLEGR